MARVRTGAALLGLAAGLVVVMATPTTTASATATSASATNILRYAGTLHGGIVVIGNSLGLAKDAGVNGPGLKDSIGTFMAAGSTGADTVPANPGNPWPAGTTNDWHSDASADTLTLPTGAVVQYAELVWGGSYNYVGETPATDLSASVTLMNGGQSTSVAPDASTATTIATTGHTGTGTPFAANYYERSANVTAWVLAHGAGSYTVGGVPGTEATTIESLNAAGWSLAVVYADPAAPVRYVGLTVGAAFVDEMGTSDANFNSFCAATGAQASVVASAMEGDANSAGDQLLTAPTSIATFVSLSGPNNPANNFFASQINGPTGALDTTGTFGSLNHHASTGANVVGGRQGWDVTTIPTPMAGGQTSLDVRASTTGDSFVPVLVGLQTSVKAPALGEGASSLAPASIAPGEVSTLTVPLTSTGELGAQATKFRLTVPPGLTLGAVTVDGLAVPTSAAALASGLDLGTIATGATRTVRVQVTGAVGSYSLAPTWSYTFNPCDGSTATLAGAGAARTLSVLAPVPPDRSPPDTSIIKHPKKKGTQRKVAFAFSATEAGATFACSLDHKAFSPCVSGKKTKVKLGKHTFEVRAIDAAGNSDATPAAYRFKVVRRPA
jgi:hypothetical protein